MLRRALEPFRGTAVHYAVAYLDAVLLGAARDMADREVRILQSSPQHAVGLACNLDRLLDETPSTAPEYFTNTLNMHPGASRGCRACALQKKGALRGACCDMHCAALLTLKKNTVQPLLPLLTQQPGASRRHDTLLEPQFSISAAQIACLEEHGYLIMDEVLSRQQIHSARCDADLLEFFPTQQHGASVRTDEVRWLRHEEPTANVSPSTPEGGVIGPNLSIAINRIRSVAYHLQVGGFRGFRAQNFAAVSLGVPRALQLGRYPPQNAQESPLYRPHRDGYTFKPWSLSALFRRIMYPEQSAVNARRLTAVLYLQKNDAFRSKSEVRHFTRGFWCKKCFTCAT